MLQIHETDPMSFVNAWEKKLVRILGLICKRGNV